MSEQSNQGGGYTRGGPDSVRVSYTDGVPDGVRAPLADRVAELEARVARLEQIVERLARGEQPGRLL